ncbi:ADP-glyceromanno-heptose 6-epimerase [Methylobacterium trifolii]|uniref:ADP-L-glycero-D-manno-heptose-6-epimerase n=1 Tax=Methylobacterium trifolii TaxID=1003092 RepID=A0ABQ4TWK0_9HYPH|nr:ADP-glyceromanno-heptose 6-epimerase [Methylobacterium trifolii]GJE58358.1 ADP-L-glycero-D-manno-heptose-6-epimerase [Methylobacterium trifolii]
MPQLSILVTGGAGFIGSCIARHLSDQGHAVTVCDRFGSSDKWRNLVKARLAGLVLPEDLPELLAGTRFDVVVHMGAISATTERDVDLIVRTNVALSLRLWDYCVAERARFIYASSAATYGESTDGFEDDWSMAALRRLRPLNAYGWSKSLFDQIVVGRFEAGGACPPQWAGLKFFNVFGPNEYHKDSMRSVVCKVYDQIAAGKPVTLFKSYRDGIPDGGQQRDFVYVQDCVAVVDWLIGTPAIHGLFNVGTGQARSFRDLALATFAALNLPPRIDYVEMPVEIRDQYQYFTESRMDRLRQAGYDRPFLSLEEAVRDYVQGYLAAGNEADRHR